LNRWWQTSIRHKEDPYLKIGETNDRTKKGESEYVWALRDIDFEVKKGDVLGIIGKNGAGKSTLLKILSRVTTPTTGTIEAKGRIASLLEVGTGFHPELTGRENIYMNGSIMGMTRKEIDRKLDEIVDFAGVERYIDTPAKRYSSGMTVRLGFAIAAHLDPEILVVDEVLAVGDAEFQKKAIGKMQDVSRGEGRTVLFVSHNMGSIKELCSRAILLNNGKVEQDGDVTTIINKYIESNISSEIFWQRQESLNSIASFLTVSVINSKGNLSSTVGNKENFFIKIEIKIEKTNFNGTFAVEFLNVLDDSILCSHDYDMGTTFINEGIYVAYIPIPKIFRNGFYYVNIGSNYTGFTALEFFKKVVGFEYVDEINKGQIANRPGKIFIPLLWEVEKTK